MAILISAIITIIFGCIAWFLEDHCNISSPLLFYFIGYAGGATALSIGMLYSLIDKRAIVTPDIGKGETIND